MADAVGLKACPAASAGASCENHEPSSTPGDESHEPGPFETGSAPFADPIEAALATALKKASEAGQWDVVTQLARELEARRKAHRASNVVPLASGQRKQSP